MVVPVVRAGTETHVDTANVVRVVRGGQAALQLRGVPQSLAEHNLDERSGGGGDVQRAERAIGE